MAERKKRPRRAPAKREAGFPLVVTAPSGTGKTSICRAVAKQMKKLSYSLSLTTRQRRKGERNGKDYTFVTEKRFKQLAAAGKLAEWAVVYGSYYGTPKKRLEENLDKGCCVILALDHNGGEAIRKHYDDSVLVYLLPPSMKELERRLRGRSTDSNSSVRRRLKSAQKELGHAKKYDYLVVNKKLSETVSVLKSIISAESHRRERFGEIKFQ